MYKLVAKLTTTARCFSGSPPAVGRLYSTTTTTKPPPPHHHQFNPNPVALQMIDYAFSLSRSLKSDESYGQGLLVLEQCESNQHDSNSKGLVLLAISTHLSERGNIVEAIEKLNTIKDLEVTYFPLKVAATEALAGLHLELGEDDTSSVIADVCINDLDAIKAELGVGFGSFDTRARALKGLIELARGNADSSQSCFKDVEGNLGIGNDALSYAEFLHTTRDFSTAKQLYQKVIKEIPGTKDYSDPYNLAAGNMAQEDILMAATCALGQLESHMGNFGGAEEILTRALTMTEERFGPHHPKIGIILTCIALMFRHKATMERSSSLMVQEEGPLLTEDVIKENEEFVLRTGSVGAGCSQLLSDMQAFKAANPGCILEDFVRWHSPPDWTETLTDDQSKAFIVGDNTSPRGHLSTRMQKEGNLWRQLWETAKPIPAVRQSPLY